MPTVCGLLKWLFPATCLLCDTSHLLLQLPNFNALFIVSLVAAVTSISYSTIGWVSAVAEGRDAAVSYALPDTGTAKIMSIFNALGTCVFAYGGHSVVLEIQVRTPHLCICVHQQNTKV